jgi:hypothetical protein
VSASVHHLYQVSLTHQLVYQYRQQCKSQLVSGRILYQKPLHISALLQWKLERARLVIIVLLEVRGPSIVLITVVLVNIAQLELRILTLQLVKLAIINRMHFSQLATHV